MSEQAARYQRSTSGLVAALVVLLVVTVGWVGVRALLLPREATPAKTVDYAQVVPPARKAAGFALVAPARLPDGWRATSVRFTDGPRGHWHLGVLTDNSRYVGLEQGRTPVASMVEQYVDPSAARGSAVTVAGRPWSTYTDGGGDIALVRRQQRTTTLVVGHDVAKAELVDYAARLR